MEEVGILHSRTRTNHPELCDSWSLLIDQVPLGDPMVLRQDGARRAARAASGGATRGPTKRGSGAARPGEGRRAWREGGPWEFEPGSTGLAGGCHRS